MRVAAIVLALVLVAVARAQDDDAILDTPSLGEPIPERMQTLEKEWDDDVGTKDHAPEPADEPDPFERNVAPEDAAEPEVTAPAPAAAAVPDAPPKRASTLEDPLTRDPPPSKPIPAQSAGGPPPKPTPAERRAAALKDAD